MKFAAPVDRLSDETRQAIVAAHGRESASALALRLGVKRNTVLGTWFRDRARKPRDKRPEKLTVTGLHGVSLPRLSCLEDAR